MDKTECNGWINYPTWLLASTIDNDETMYKFFKGIASMKDLTMIIRNLQDLMENDHLFTRNVKESLIEYALEQIDYPAIARAMIEEIE